MIEIIENYRIIEIIESQDSDFGVISTPAIAYRGSSQCLVYSQYTTSLKVKVTIKGHKNHLFIMYNG